MSSKRIKVEELEESKESSGSLKSLESSFGISPGSFAMLMGVHVRFRLERDPIFTDPNFLSEPLNGPCKPESLMKMELKCLLEDNDTNNYESVVKEYNQALLNYTKEIMESKQKPFDLMANRWNSYPIPYANDVKTRYNRVLIEYPICSGNFDVNPDDNFWETKSWLMKIYDIMKYLDLYPFLIPGLFLVTLGIHSRFPKTKDQVRYPFTGECKPLVLMAKELSNFLQLSEHFDNPDDDTMVIESTQEDATYHNENAIVLSTTTILENAIQVIKFLNRLRVEYRNCKPQSQSHQQYPTDPRFLNRIFVCDKDSINYPRDSSADPIGYPNFAEVTQRCFDSECEDRDPITYDTLQPFPIKLLVGGKPVCYNHESLKRSLEGGGLKREPSTRIPFLQDQVSYLSKLP